jgi:hypothetical protein
LKPKPNRPSKAFRAVFQLPVKELLERLKRNMITKYGYKSKKMLSGDKFLYAPGSIPVMVVAHLDTVHTSGPEVLLYDSYNEILVARNSFGRATGLGADDRAGVWAICQLLEMGFRPHVLWTDLEEKGCQGAEQAAKVLEKCPPKIKFMVEFDRMHDNDCVFYQCDNRDFVKHVEGYGFKEAQGSSTDIRRLMPALKTAGVNLSIGYYNQHTTDEVLYIKQMNRTIAIATRMLNDALEERVPHFPFCEKKWEYQHSTDSYNVGEYISSYRTKWKDEGDSRTSGGKRLGGTPPNGQKHGLIERVPGQEKSGEVKAIISDGEDTWTGDLLHWERRVLADIEAAEKEQQELFAGCD